METVGREFIFLVSEESLLFGEVELMETPCPLGFAHSSHQVASLRRSGINGNRLVILLSSHSLGRFSSEKWN